jgi:hypothetical protein
MIPVRSIAPLVVVGFFAACFLANAADGDESPRAVIEAALRTHGGKDNLMKTVCGNVLANGKMLVAPGEEAAITWAENYEVPRRFRRKIVGVLAGAPVQMEYAITEGSGWILENGQLRDFKGDKSLGSQNWGTSLIVLVRCLEEGVTLKSAGTEMVDGKSAKKVHASGDAVRGSVTLFLDEKTNRLVKEMRRAPNPLTGKEVDAAFVLGDFKKVSGVLYPHQIVGFTDGTKMFDLEIMQVDFPKTLDDKLFVKPE